jgi:hypothetical protein
MRINSRKFSEGFGEHLNAFLKPLHSWTPRCIGMNATLNFLFDLENETKAFFLYYISYKENKCW